MTLADTFCTSRFDPRPPATPTGGHGPVMARPWPDHGPTMARPWLQHSHLVIVHAWLISRRLTRSR